MVKKINLFDIVLIALLTAILFVQEFLLTNIPGVQLTIFLIVLYSKKIGFLKTTLVIIVHVLLDNLVMNSFELFYTPTMFIGLEIIPIIICSLGRKTESPFILALWGGLFSFIYCWGFVIPNHFVYDIGIIEYLLSDILFECILAICSFLTIFWLYKPCSKIFDFLNQKYKND